MCLRRSAAWCSVLLVGLLAHVETQIAGPEIRPILTDQTALSLPTTYGMVTSVASSGAGHVALVSGNGSALFFRQGTQPIVRVAQSGDVVPGVPLSRVDRPFNPQMGPSGMLAFQLDYFASGTAATGVFAFNGTTTTPVVRQNDAIEFDGEFFVARFGPAPDRLLSCSHTDVALQASLVPVGAPSGTQPESAILTVPHGGTPTRLVKVGDPAPDTGGGTLGSISSLAANDALEVLFSATILGGTGGAGLFVTSPTGTRKVVANGDPHPGGGTFFLMEPSQLRGAVLNGAGQVAFSQDANVYLSTPATGLAAVVTESTPLPSPLDSRRAQSVIGGPTLSDSGSVVFGARLTGAADQNEAVVRYRLGQPLDLVAYKGQSAPGGLGQTFQMLGWVEQNRGGDVAFSATLNPTTPSSQGIFKQPNGGSLAPVVLDNTAAPGGLGSYVGPFLVSATGAQRSLQTGGTVFFSANLKGSTATHGAFFANGLGPQPLVTSLDPLPAGSRVTFRDTVSMTGAGPFTAVKARRAGGGAALLVHDTRTDVTRQVVAEGDPFSPFGGPITGLTGKPLLHPSGAVAFSATSPGLTGAAVLLSVPGQELRQVAGPGTIVAGINDPLVNTVPQSMSAPTTTDGALHVLFTATYGADGRALCSAAPPGAPAPLVKVGDPAPTGGTFTAASFTTAAINSSGLVAFNGTTTAGATGVYLATPDSELRKIVITGDPVAGGGTVNSMTIPAPAAFGDRGSSLFFAAVTNAGSTKRGIYKGWPVERPEAVVTSGVAAPSGGNYAFGADSIDLRMNGRGDILFRAPLTGGTSSEGLFLERAGGGAVETVALKGQIAPGTSSPIANIPATRSSIPGEFTALGPGGEAMFSAPITVGALDVSALFRHRLDGVLETVAVGHGEAPGSGGGTFVNLSPTIGAGRPGQFYFRAAVVGGDFADAIYETPTATPGDFWRRKPADLGIYRRSADDGYEAINLELAQGPSGVAVSPPQFVTTFWPNGPVAADFNGDGKYDAAGYDPTTSTWLLSGQAPLAYGLPDDIPVPADYNGNHVADLAVFRPSSGLWSIRNLPSVTLGVPGDVPVPADYNGDGRADPAVFRPSSATWFVYGQPSVQWGAPGDVPVPADYDGNGAADIGVFRPSTGLWSIRNLPQVTLGQPGDIPVPADYTGDGRADVAVYRPGQSTFYIRDSATTETRVVPFGMIGDEPALMLPGQFSGTPVVTTTLLDTGSQPIYNADAPLQTPVSVKARVTGRRGTPTGTVTFTRFDNSACTGVGTPVGTSPLDGGGLARSDVFVPVGAGGLSFLTHYSGDGTYPSADGCTGLTVRQYGPTFTDDPLIMRVTPVKAGHIVELRMWIDGLRQRFGLGQVSWTDRTTLAAGMPIKAVHITEMRQAIADVYAVAARDLPTYTDPTLTPGSTPISAAHIAELRAALLGIW